MSQGLARRSAIDVWTALRTGLRAMGRNKLRSGLTMLGITIGVAAVICMQAVGEGATAQVQQAISNIGVNLIWIQAQKKTNGVRSGNGEFRTLTIEDVTAIQGQIPWVAEISPNVDTHIQVAYGNQNWNTQMRGIAPDYFQIANWKLERGQFFGEEDVQNEAKVCVMGETVAKNLFGEEDPLGKMVRVGNILCKTVGVLEIKGQAVTGQDQDDVLMMPYTTAMRKVMGVTWLDDIMCSGINASVLPVAETAITRLLRERHNIQPGMDDDFNLRHPVEIAQAVEDSTRVMKLLLATIASVSLLVGGIGVMNIMLVSVTERTREIGIRMAVGAKRYDVLAQFLTEAVLLSLLGGGIGLLLGVLSSLAVPHVLGWMTRVSPLDVLTSVLFSCAVGIFSGYYPAHRASRLDPIEALRYE